MASGSNTIETRFMGAGYAFPLPLKPTGTRTIKTHFL
jgi:hypothetical protein